MASVEELSGTVDHRRLLLIGTFLSQHVGTKGISETLADLLVARGWHVLTASSHRRRIPRVLDVVRTAVLQWRRYDVAHVDVYSGSAFAWAELACGLLRFLRKPYAITLRGGGLAAFADRWPKRVTRLLAQADRVTTPSRFLLGTFRGQRNDIQYLLNGLDVAVYPYRLRENPRPTLCWLRAFHKVYNPTLAVEVVAQLREPFPDVRLSMIGPDKRDGTFDAVVKLAAERGVTSNIEFVGAVPKAEVPTWLSKYDVFLNTTRYESFGVAVMEAGAVGLPIVTTDVGELPYLWADGENALLVPSGEPEAMATAVKRVLTEPGLASRLSSQARRNAEQYDWATILPRWEALFEALLEEAGTCQP